MAEDDLKRRVLRGIGGLAVILAVLIFAPAWSLAFWQGWLFWATFIGCTLAITLDLLRRDPDLVRRRMRSGPTAEREPVQKLIQTVTSLLFPAIAVIASLDHRFGWSQVPVAVVLLGDALVALGFLAVLRVFRENSFASTIIEVSPGQPVIATGPYALVRHPMYAASIPLILGMPLGLASWWSLAPAVLVLGAIVWRLLEEERTLSRDLKGYDDYRRNVRWRLAPGLW